MTRHHKRSTSKKAALGRRGQSTLSVDPFQALFVEYDFV